MNLLGLHAVAEGCWQRNDEEGDYSHDEGRRSGLSFFVNRRGDLD